MAEQQLLFGFEGAAPAPELADSAARRAVLDPARSFIVQAPAGSGKTEVLIQRYLALLGRVAAPESVIAITFTIKAAAEMRARVIEALRLGSGPEPEKAHERETWALARAALAQDRRLEWGLLDSPSRMRIQTIDALSMSVVRQMPWTARMGAMPKVTEDARRIYRRAAEATVRLLETDGPLGRAVESLLRHLDYNAASTADMLAGMLEIREHWLPLLGVSAGLPGLRAKLEANLAAVASAGTARLCGSLTPDQASALQSIAGIEALPRDPDGWRALTKLLLTSNGGLRKQAPKDAQQKDRLQRLYSQLEGNAEFKSAIESVKYLPNPRYTDEQWEVLEALLRLLPRAEAELRVAFAENNTVDFAEISRAALNALGTPQNPTDLGLAFGHRVEHILVDEFQDTSRAQEELLRVLTAGWEDGDGRTLFLVGDPMQSIYRFRQAEVGIFLSIRDRGLGGLNLEQATLSSNFRSTRGIVEWVNGAFEAAFPEGEDAGRGAVPYSRSSAVLEGAAEIEVHPLATRDDALETALVIGQIEKARERGETVGVLVRARAHLLETAARLRERGIAFRAVEIDSLAERPVVQDLLALTRALLHLADRPAWLAILRAPWCGLTLAELETLASDRSRTLWEVCAEKREGLPRMDRIYPVLAAALAQRGRMPLRRLVEGAWIALEGPACLMSAADQIDARAFFDLLEQEESGGDLADLDEFSRQVAELYAAPDPAAPGSLELMTIHRAKGLEFDCVIIPGMGRGARQDEARLLSWSWLPDGTVYLAPITARHRDTEPICRFLAAEERERAKNEVVRLLYVACTRARRRLHLIGHAEKGKAESGSFFHEIWAAVEKDFQFLKNEEAAGAAAEPPKLRRLSRWSSGERPAFGPSPVVKQGAPVPAAVNVGAAVGTATHLLLKRIAEEGVEAWSEARVRAARPLIEFVLKGDGVAGEELAQASGIVERALVNALADARGRWILGARMDAVSECEVAAVVNGEVEHLRIDRTFIGEDGARWIVDFKVESPDEAGGHWPQLERYARVLGELDSRPVRIALYYPLNGIWLERAPD